MFSLFLAAHQLRQANRTARNIAATCLGFLLTISCCFAEALAPAPDLVKFSDTQAFGYVNKNAEVVIPPKFEKAFAFAENGLARVVHHGKFGFINTKGEWVIEPRFFHVDEFSSDGLAKAQYGSISRNILAWGGFGRTTKFKQGVINTGARQGSCRLIHAAIC